MLKMGKKNRAPHACWPAAMMEATTSLLPAVRSNHRELHLSVTRSHGELVAGLGQSQDDKVRMISTTVLTHFVLFIVRCASSGGEGEVSNAID